MPLLANAKPWATYLLISLEVGCRYQQASRSDELVRIPPTFHLCLLLASQAFFLHKSTRWDSLVGSSPHLDSINYWSRNMSKTKSCASPLCQALRTEALRGFSVMREPDAQTFRSFRTFSKVSSLLSTSVSPDVNNNSDRSGVSNQIRSGHVFPRT